MDNVPKSLKRFSDKEVITLFIEHFSKHGNPGIKIDVWPDQNNRQSKDIDAIAGPYAIEHTSIDTIPDQRRDSAWFLQIIRPLEDEFQNKLPYRLALTLPYEGIQIGQDWFKITDALRNWVKNESPKIPQSTRLIFIKDVPGIPFGFYCIKRNSPRTGLLFSRVAPNDQSFPDRLKAQMGPKIKKLLPYKALNKTTVLLIESDDIALMNEDIMWDGLKSAYSNGLPQGLDRIWFADTSIPKEVLFWDMTKAV